jgi:hypothetical protein
MAKQTLGPATPVWLALIATVLATEWIHFFLGTGPEKSHPGPASA